MHNVVFSPVVDRCTMTSGRAGATLTSLPPSILPFLSPHMPVFCFFRSKQVTLAERSDDELGLEYEEDYATVDGGARSAQEQRARSGNAGNGGAAPQICIS